MIEEPVEEKNDNRQKISDDRGELNIEKFKIMLPEEIKDHLNNTKLMLGRKKEKAGDYIDERGMEKMMREYTVFDRRGKVDEIELTDNIFYRSKIPDHYFVPVDPRAQDRDVYKNAAVAKIIKPVITQDQKVLMFEFSLEELVEWDGIVLKLKVENENPHNYLQIDGNPNKIIKSLKLLLNGELVEEHTDWGKILEFAECISDLSIKKQLQHNLKKVTGEDLISPAEYGTNLIFNPPTRMREHISINRVKNGKIDYTDSNVAFFEIVIKTYTFGNLFSGIRSQLNDLRGPVKITLAVEINDQAFFVPVFGARIEDLIDVAVSNSSYVVMRKQREQLKKIKDYKKGVKHSSKLGKATFPISDIEMYFSDVLPIKDNFNYVNGSGVVDYLKLAFNVNNSDANSLLKSGTDDTFLVEKLKQVLVSMGIDFRLGVIDTANNVIELDSKENADNKYFLVLTENDKEFKSIRVMFKTNFQMPGIESFEITRADFFDVNKTDFSSIAFNSYWNKETFRKLDHNKRMMLYNFLKTGNMLNFEITETADFTNDEVYFNAINPKNAIIYYGKGKEIKEVVNIVAGASKKDILSKLKTIRQLGILQSTSLIVFAGDKMTYGGEFDKREFFGFSDSTPLAKTDKFTMDIPYTLNYISPTTVEVSFNVPERYILNESGVERKRLKFDTNAFLDKLVGKTNIKQIANLLTDLRGKGGKSVLYFKNKDKFIKFGMHGDLLKGGDDRKNVLNLMLNLLDASALELDEAAFKKWIPFSVNIDDKVMLPFERSKEGFMLEKMFDLYYLFDKDLSSFPKSVQNIYGLSELLLKDEDMRTKIIDAVNKRTYFEGSTIPLYASNPVYYFLEELELDNNNFFDALKLNFTRKQSLIESIGYKLNKAFQGEVITNLLSSTLLRNMTAIFLNADYNKGRADDVQLDIIEVPTMVIFSPTARILYRVMERLDGLNNITQTIETVEFSQDMSTITIKKIGKWADMSPATDWVVFQLSDLSNKDNLPPVGQSFIKWVATKAYNAGSIAFKPVSVIYNIARMVASGTSNRLRILFKGRAGKEMLTFDTLLKIMYFFSTAVRNTINYTFSTKVDAFSPEILHKTVVDRIGADKPVNEGINFSFGSMDYIAESIIENSLTTIVGNITKAKELLNASGKIESVKHGTKLTEFIHICDSMSSLVNSSIMSFHDSKENRITFFLLMQPIETVAYLLKQTAEDYSTQDDNHKEEYLKDQKEKISKLIVYMFQRISLSDIATRANITDRISDVVKKYLDPKHLDVLELDLLRRIKESKFDPWISQDEFMVLKDEKRPQVLSLDISNTFTITDAILEIKTLPIFVEPIPVLPEPRRVVQNIYSGIFDVEKDFYLPLRNPLIRKIFIFFEDFGLSERVTFRKSTKLSMPLETFALITGDRIYPPSFFKGVITNSDENAQFLEELAYTIGKIDFNGKGSVERLERETIFNRYNFALQESTTSFITKKLYGLPCGDFFGFDSNSNKLVDAVFGYDEEILPQFMLGFDFTRIEQMFGLETPIVDIRFTFDYNKLVEFKNKLKIHIYTEFYLS